MRESSGEFEVLAEGPAAVERGPEDVDAAGEGGDGLVVAFYFAARAVPPVRARRGRETSSEGAAVGLAERAEGGLADDCGVPEEADLGRLAQDRSDAGGGERVGAAELHMLAEASCLEKSFRQRVYRVVGKQSAGMQALDVVLWRFKRVLNGEDLPPDSVALMQFVFRDGRQRDFSFSGVSMHLQQMLEDIWAIPLAEVQCEKGQVLLTRFKQGRQERMIEYAEARRLQSHRWQAPAMTVRPRSPAYIYSFRSPDQSSERSSVQCNEGTSCSGPIVKMCSYSDRAQAFVSPLALISGGRPSPFLSSSDCVTAGQIEVGER
jgi:hypothetical protein